MNITTTDQPPHQLLGRLAALAGLGTSLPTFLPTLARLLKDGLGVDHVIIVAMPTGLQPGRCLAASPACPIDEATLATASSRPPFTDIIPGSLCVHDRDVALRHPDNPALATLGPEAFAGSALVDASGVLVGVLALCSAQVFRDPGAFDIVLPIASALASAELNRHASATALHDTEEQFQSILDDLPLAFSLKSLDQRYLRVNKPFESWSGMARADILGKSFTTIAPIKQDPKLRAAIQKHEDDVLHTGRAFSRRELSSIFDAEPNWVLIRKFPVRGADGGIIGIGTATTDLTELNQMEEAVRQRERLLVRHQDALLDILREIGSASWTLDAVVRMITETVAQALGTSRASVWQIDHDQDKPVLRCLDAWHGDLHRHETREPICLATIPVYAEALRQEKVLDVPDAQSDPRTRELAEQHLKPAGITSLLDVAMEIAGGIGVVLCAEHIGPQRQWSVDDLAFARSAANLLGIAALAGRHGDVLAALDLAKDGICVEDRDGRIIFANQALTRLAALTAKNSATAPPKTSKTSKAAAPVPDPAQIAQMPGGDTTDELRRIIAEKSDAAVEAAGTWSGEFAWERAQHPLVWLDVNRVRLPGGGSVTVIDEITDRKLQHDRQAKIERRIQEASKMEAIGRLAGGIAHDFNNLLGSIMGFASFLIEDLPPEGPEHGFASRIMLASERAKDLVRQILIFSRSNDTEWKTADVTTILRDVGKLLKGAIPSSTRISLDLPKEPLMALVNVGKLGQAVLNVCVNANEALAGETGSVTLSAVRLRPGLDELRWFGTETKGSEHPRLSEEGGLSRVVCGLLDPDRDYVQITVSDTGPGMTPTVMAHLFEPFFTTKERSRGTGLGLAVMHGTVVSMGGAYRLESRMAAGTECAIYVPIAEDGLAQSAGRGAGAAQGRERILAVDDEQDILDVLAIGLGRLGYAVTTVNDPVKALDMFCAHPDHWDLVISDQVMPGLKGLTMIGLMKEIRPSVPAILCTGFSDGATEEVALAAGAAAYFAKPVPADRIASRIRQVLEKPITTE
jgi:PAS domain S-box-containing protein